jgi:hypothetical protein
MCATSSLACRFHIHCSSQRQRSSRRLMHRHVLAIPRMYCFCDWGWAALPCCAWAWAIPTFEACSLAIRCNPTFACLVDAVR